MKSSSNNMNNQREYRLVIILVLVALVVATGYYLNSQPDTHRHQPPHSQALSKQDEAFLHSETLPDFSSIDDTKKKKVLFIEYIYRHAMATNRSLRELAGSLQGINDEELRRLSEKYKIDDAKSSRSDILQELRSRIQPVTPSLVIAQAANESAWGTSRFAREANNLFGQWCFRQGCGIVPKKRGKGAKHEVRKFASPGDSVAAYIHNLNSNDTYRILREIRSKNPDATGSMLAEGLVRYSQRGKTYVYEIKKIIKQNNLERYDTSM